MSNVKTKKTTPKKATLAKKVTAKRVVAKKAAPAKKRAALKPAAKKAAGGYRFAGASMVNTYLFCDLHDLRYPRGETCPRCD